MRLRNKHKLDPVKVLPGDELRCTVHDRKGHFQTFVEKIGKAFTVDTIVTFDVDEPLFGLKDGVGAIFGTSE
jgi:hypothetical protein